MTTISVCIWFRFPLFGKQSPVILPHKGKLAQKSGIQSHGWFCPSAIPKVNCVYSSALLAVLFKGTAHNFPVVQRGVLLGSFPFAWNAYINKNHRVLKVMHYLYWNTMRHLEFGRRLQHSFPPSIRSLTIQWGVRKGWDWWKT